MPNFLTVLVFFVLILFFIFMEMQSVLEVVKSSCAFSFVHINMNKQSQKKKNLSYLKTRATVILFDMIFFPIVYFKFSKESQCFFLYPKQILRIGIVVFFLHEICLSSNIRYLEVSVSPSRSVTFIFLIRIS